MTALHFTASKIEKAEKKIKEAEDYVFDAAKDAEDRIPCQKGLIIAAKDLEKAEAEIEEADEY